MMDKKRNEKDDSIKNVMVIVAHPDDETLWAGGLILDNIGWNVFVLCLCRGSDTDRAPKFRKALQILNATGKIDDMDDGPEQIPLDPKQLEDRILLNIPRNTVDLVISHSPFGEYTRHRRHEEVGNAVISLWQQKKLTTGQLWLFAYEDGNKNYYPQPAEEAHKLYPLAEATLNTKYRIITETYGFSQESWEAKICPKTEAFWKFLNTSEVDPWRLKLPEKTNLPFSTAPQNN